MDDEVAVVQGGPLIRQQVHQAMLHAVDQVLRPLQVGDRPERKEPVSVKKLRKGDACWRTRKNILGWLVDTRQRTIHLPEHRRHRLDAVLASVHPNQTTTSLCKWRQLLGELRSMSVAIPAGRGFYSHLQCILPTDPSLSANTRVRITPQAHRALGHFRRLATTLRQRPTRWAELLPAKEPHVLGTVDASAAGMGGAWFLPGSPPLCWRAPFPLAVTGAVVSFDNPTGSVTNSDLELAGLAVHFDVLATAMDVRERTVHALSDNTAALSWARKGSSSSTGPRSGLLEYMAVHQRSHRYCTQSSHIPGEHNVLADDLSRRWDLTDLALLDRFNTLYRQASPWTLCHPRPSALSAMTSALLQQPWDMEQLLRGVGLETPPLIGGQACSPSLAKTPSSRLQPKRGPGCFSLHIDTAPVSSHPMANQSNLARWRTRYDWWRRPTAWLATRT